MFKSIQQSLLLALCATAPAVSAAATLSEDEAKNVAAEFFQSGDVSRLAHKDALTLAFVAKDGQSNPVSYVFNAKDGRGFVIVSADSDALPVLGYSDTSVWDVAAQPASAREFISSPVRIEEAGRRIMRTARYGEQTSKLLETPSWSQEAPFNNNIPNRRLTGCVGVALAEIMKYHNFPAARPTSLVNLGEAPDYQWGMMRMDNYRTGYGSDEAEAVATLVADAAIGIGTDFGMSSSSAFEVKVPYALTSLFGYDAGVSYKKRDELDKASWDALIVNEINEGRPVLYSGQDVSSGHAFVCDGYEMRGDTPYFHINWGWGGSANGYFASDALNPVVSKAHSYNDLMTIIYNIKPAASALEWSPIHVTSDERQIGLTLDTDDITSVDNFTVRVGSFKNISNSDFSGKIAVALFSADGKQKCLLSAARNFNLVALQISKYLDFSCSVPSGTQVADGDVVRMVTQVADGAAWLPVAGDNMLAPGEMLAKGSSLSYFNVMIPASADFVEIDGGEGRVIKGRDYSFKVVSTAADKVVTVKANGFILTPDAANNYKLTNVLADQKIDIIVQNAADVLSKSVLWVTAGNLKNLLNENETATVTDLTLFGTMNVDDFTFIRERMKVNRLDISQVSILASGSNPANAIPTKAFTGYRSLQTIILPNNLSTFKNGCLAQTGLRSIDIPASVGTWEYNVFVGCNQLREVIARRSSPAWVNWCVFSGVPQDKLIVPVGSAAAYGAKEYWADFKEIVEGVPAAPTTFSVTVAEKKGLKFTSLTEGTEFEKGAAYDFKLETDNSFGDAVMQVYANATLLKADAEGVYHATVNGNTLIHVEFREPQATTVDKYWKLSNVEGGIGLVSSVVNVPFGKTFTVRANAIKVPAGDHAVKVYAIALTDKDGNIKEFISQQIQNYSGAGANLLYNFTCQVKEAEIKEGNQLRLVTSYDKKTWQYVVGEDETITDRLEAIGNPVIYHNVTMPASVTGARIEGGATEVVRGMPLNVKVSAINPAQRVTVGVNGETKALKVASANISIPAVLEDLDITILVSDAEAGDYHVINIQEGQLASKLAECPERVKLVGTMHVDEFDALRANASTIIDLDMADVTIKGAMMTGNAIPENAFAPKASNGLSALKTIILPNSIERINKNAFARCTQVSEITIPSKVEYIGDAAFTSCVSLKKIIAQPKVAPTCGNSSPFPSNPSSISLEVPKGSEASYSVASTWWSMLSLYQVPAEHKDYYWVKLDKSRIGVYDRKLDLDRIAVGQNEETQVLLILPNNQSNQYKIEDVLRPGVIFKLYDNGIDVFNNLATYNYQAPGSFQTVTPEQSWSMIGGRLMLRWVPSSTWGPTIPQNHEIDLVFYYTVSFENLAGAQGVTSEFVEMPEGCEWKNIAMSRFTYLDGRVMNTKVVPVAYREGSELKFRLFDAAPKTELVVSAISKVMTKPGSTPEYEEREVTLVPDNGIYTIPALEGDTRIRISGITSYEETDPIPADNLSTLKQEQMETFTELTVTGEMNESDFETIRENFESVETIDLSQIQNEVIPENAFAGMDNLRIVMIPETVTEIGEGAFQGCEGIETLTLPGVNSIGEGAFEGCTNLTSILIPSSDAVTAPTPAEAPAKRIRRAGVARAGSGITAESFRGINPNCLIYMGANEIPDSEELNIILNQNGTRVAASDINLDGNHSFSAPASFNLGDHRIAFTVEIPGSLNSDDNDGWKGIMLPFSPTSMEYGVEFGKRPGSGLNLVSFDNEEAEVMTPQDKILANRPYMANVSAPYAVVPVTFYAESLNDPDSFDIPFTPVAEENVAAGKNFSLFGSYDGETVLGTCYTLNETADSFIRPADGEDVPVGSFSAYLCANDGVDAADFNIGEHPLWICEPELTGVTGTKLYRNNKIGFVSPTAEASIYYTTDGSDPTDAEGTRKLYEEPFAMDADVMDLKVVAMHKDYTSEQLDFNFELKKVDLDYDLAKNWNWISHNMENSVAVADFLDNDVTRILSQDEEAVNDPQYGLVGTLTALDPAVAYKVCVGADSWKGNVAGAAFDPSEPVALKKGWNWIGSPVDDASTLVSDLFSALDLEEGDMIVGLEGFTQVDAEGEWQGTLDRLVPGVGYMFFSNSDKEFTYAIVAAEEAQSERMAAPAETIWPVDIHAYPSVMPMTAVLADASADDYVIGAFCGEECRGIGVAVGDAVMFNIHGQRGDVLTFRYMDGSRTLASVDNIIFDENPVGTFADPYELHVSGTVAVETVNGVDGYLILGENGEISIKGDLSKVLSVEIFDMDGHKLAEGVKTTDGLKVSDLESGVCIILVRTTEGSLYRKVMVK